MCAVAESASIAPQKCVRKVIHAEIFERETVCLAYSKAEAVLFAEGVQKGHNIARSGTIR